MGIGTANRTVSRQIVFTAFRLLGSPANARMSVYVCMHPESTQACVIELGETSEIPRTLR